MFSAPPTTILKAVSGTTILLDGKAVAARMRGEVAALKPGAAVFDVGINRDAAGRLVGDVGYDRAAERAGWITPVPGGLGPMTIAMVLSNAVEAACRRMESRAG
ncbi:MAG: hypothetical protein ACRES6_08560 [Steroidobacteraceae bacterium]